MGVKKCMVLVLTLVMMSSLFAGCSKKEVKTANNSDPATTEATTGASTETTAATQTKDKKVFAASYFTMNNPHFIEWSKGLKSVIVDQNGDELIDLDAQLDINKQISDIEDVLQRDIDGIFVAPVDAKGIRTALEACNRSDVPVFIMDVPLTDEDAKYATFQVTTDNYMAGKVAAEALVKKCGGKANVAIIDWSVNQAVVLRTSGFMDVIKDYPDIKVVARQDAEASTESALPLMENFLQSNPEITDVFAINDPSAMGALSAIEAAQRTDIRIYSIDGSADGIKLAKEGKIVGTSAQFPFKMGQTAATNAYDFVSGKKVEPKILIESVFVDASNADQFAK